VSEKLKPNFTPVPNIIFDEVMRTLASAAVKVLFAICRYTYGWGKKSDRISLNQLSAMTGMDRANVSRSIRSLGQRVIVTAGDPRTNQASEYRINIEISESDLVSPVQQGLVSRKQQASVRPSVKTPPIQRKTKERREVTDSDKLNPDSLSTKTKRKLTRPDPAVLAAFDGFYQAYPRHVAKQKGLEVWLKLSLGAELIPIIMAAVERYAAEVRDTEPKLIPHPATWLNGRRWEDESGSRNGNGKPAQVKELSNGMIEVDGRQIERALYERRYGYLANRLA
jgi:phage replication O-like protein O